MDQNSQTTSGLNVLANIYQPGTLNIIGGRLGIGKTTLAFNLAWCKNHHKGLTVHVIKVLPPSFGSIPVIENSWFGNMVDFSHTVDYQKELDLADGNLPFGEFLSQMDEKIAGIIKGNF